MAPPLPAILPGLTFGSPWMLLGLALALVPLLLHWLFRRPEREERWAAMDVLRRAIARRSRRMRLQTLLLLGVRMLILALAALAFARPTVEVDLQTSSSPVARRRFLLFDASLSMTSQERSDSPFESARGAAQRILDQGAPGDSYRLLKIATGSAPDIVSHFSADLAGISREIDRLRPADSGGDPLAALSAVLSGLDDPAARGPERCDVVILSDFQEHDWTAGGARGARLAGLLQSLGRLAQVVLVPLGDRELDNSAITSTKFSEELIGVGRPVHLSVEVRNDGRQNLTNIAVEATVADTVRAVTRIDLPAQQSTIADLELAFDAAGETAVEIGLTDDRLPADNRAYQVVRVRDRVRVLLVDSGIGPQAGLRGATYVALALDPDGRRRDVRTPAIDRWISVETINVVNLREQDLNPFDAVYLCGVPRLVPDEAERLRRYVQDGGGLVIGLSSQVDLDNYNERLGPPDRGPLPARLSGWAEASPERATPLTFELPAEPHRILNPFVGNPDSGLSTTRVWSHARVVDPARSPLLSLSDGSPVLLEQSFGRGLCVLSTVAFDARGSNWALWPSFLPLIQEMTAYAASAGGPRIVTAGAPLEFPPPDGMLLRLTRPGGTVDDRSVDSPRAEMPFIVPDASTAGIYELEVRPPQTPTPDQATAPQTAAGDLDVSGARHAGRHLAAVNPDTSESHVVRLRPEELDSLFNGVPHIIQSDWAPTASKGSESPASGRQLAGGMLWIVVLLAICEVALTYRFNWGAVLLAATVAAVTIRPWIGVGPAAASGIGLAALAILADVAWRRRRA